MPEGGRTAGPPRPMRVLVAAHLHAQSEVVGRLPAVAGQHAVKTWEHDRCGLRRQARADQPWRCEFTGEDGEVAGSALARVRGRARYKHTGHAQGLQHRRLDPPLKRRRRRLLEPLAKDLDAPVGVDPPRSGGGQDGIGIEGDAAGVRQQMAHRGARQHRPSRAMRRARPSRTMRRARPSRGIQVEQPTFHGDQRTPGHNRLGHRGEREDFIDLPRLDQRAHAPIHGQLRGDHRHGEVELGERGQRRERGPACDRRRRSGRHGDPRHDRFSSGTGAAREAPP